MSNKTTEKKILYRTNSTVDRIADKDVEKNEPQEDFLLSFTYKHFTL